MNIDNPIIFFGTEDFSAVSLQRLIDDKFNIVGIVTKPDSKKRSRPKNFYAKGKGNRYS